MVRSDVIDSMTPHRIDRRAWNRARRLVRPLESDCVIETADTTLPIRTLMLGDHPGRAVYIVTPGTGRLSRTLDDDADVAVTAHTTDSGLVGRVLGRSRSGVRLTGRVGRRRPATPLELDRWRTALANTRTLDGQGIRFDGFAYVRELRFESVITLDD